jgi:hypothetical protein
MIRFSLCCAFFLALAVLVTPCQAQYQIQLSLEKKTFLSQEPMLATLSISNNSGTDVVMGGRTSNWLQFHLTNSNGQSFPPVGVEVEESYIFKAGESMKRKIVLTDTHAISEIGSYAITAVVYHAPTADYYQSNRVRFTIMDVKPIWQQTFGVPQGEPEAGRVRVHSIHIMREENGSNLYYRLTDERSQMRLATYTLGPISQALDPTFTLDPQNQLQLFFLAAPRIFAHCIIGTDGKIVTRKYYREGENNRPFMAMKQGAIIVQGGIPFDPSAPVVGPATDEGVRKASERPPGL